MYPQTSDRADLGSGKPGDPIVDSVIIFAVNHLKLQIEMPLFCDQQWHRQIFGFDIGGWLAHMNHALLCISMDRNRLRIQSKVSPKSKNNYTGIGMEPDRLL